jgi:hypothetical protein
VLRVPSPEIGVFGHPGLAAAFLLLLTRTSAATHRHPAAGVGRGPGGNGVVGSDEPGSPAVARSHSAFGEAGAHAVAELTRAGADHSVGADSRAAGRRIAGEVLTDHPRATGAAATGRVAEAAGTTTAAARGADAARATGEAADRNRIPAVTGHTAHATGIGTITRDTSTRRTRIGAARHAADRNRIGAARHAARRKRIATIARHATRCARIGAARRAARWKRIGAITGRTARCAGIVTTRRSARSAGSGIARNRSTGRWKRADRVGPRGPARRPTGGTAGRHGAGPRARRAAATAGGKPRQRRAG